MNTSEDYTNIIRLCEICFDPNQNSEYYIKLLEILVEHRSKYPNDITLFLDHIVEIDINNGTDGLCNELLYCISGNYFSELHHEKVKKLLEQIKLLIMQIFLYLKKILKDKTCKIGITVNADMYINNFIDMFDQLINN